MGYSYQVYVDTSGVGHVFLKITDPNGNSEAWGYYPKTPNAPSGPGDLKRDDQLTDPNTGLANQTHRWDWTPGPVEITSEQYQKIYDYARWVDEHPVEYGFFDNNCVEFVEDALRIIGDRPMWQDAVYPPQLKWQMEIYDWYHNALPGYLNDLYLRARNLLRRDPLAIDLDGDGIKTVGVDAGVLFDHDADAIKTGTGWLKAADAFVVLDRDGNGTIDSGRELFGVDTIVGTEPLTGRAIYAVDAFDALKSIDSNGDKLFNSADEIGRAHV